MAALITGSLKVGDSLLHVVLRSSYFGAVEAVDLRRGFRVHARATVSARLRFAVDLVAFGQSTMEFMRFNILLVLIARGSPSIQSGRDLV